MKLNPRVDFAFKKIFGSEENKDLLHSLLNSIVPPEDQVKSLTLLNPYTEKSYMQDKLSILDIRAIDQKGRPLCIEMQVTDQLHYEKRALFLWSKVYSEQLRMGDPYSTLKKTIGIHLLNFNLMDEPGFHNVYAVMNQKSHKRQFADFQLHVVELEKFDQHKTAKTALDRWVTFLTKAHEITSKRMPQPLASDSSIKRAMEVLETLHLSEEERKVYDGQQTWLRDEAAAIEKAEFKAEARGKAEGLLEGEARGKAEGKAEALAVMVLGMNAQNIPLAVIQKVTGLSASEVKTILKKK